MARLTGRDLAAFVKALLALYAEDEPESLSRRVLTCLRGLFDCEFVSFSRMDLPAGRLQTTVFAPSALTGWPGMATHQRFLPTDPAAVHILRTGEQGVVKTSDFVSLREYRNLPVYTEVFARVGCDRRLGFVVRSDSPSAMIATINRAGKDFSEEDRTRLDLLRPHLIQASARADACVRLRVEREQAREEVGQAFGAGLGEIDAAGNLLWLTAQGCALLADFFPYAGKQVLPETLPEALGEPLKQAMRRGTGGVATEQAVRPRRHAWQFPGPDGRKLNVRLVAGVARGRWHLLLVETGASSGVRALAQSYGLTGREQEVFHWLTQGKTNGEMGTILAVTEKTVGKHLEHIFAKLGVENRTSAVGLALDFSAGLASR